MKNYLSKSLSISVLALAFSGADAQGITGSTALDAGDSMYFTFDGKPFAGPFAGYQSNDTPVQKIEIPHLSRGELRAVVAPAYAIAGDVERDLLLQHQPKATELACQFSRAKHEVLPNGGDATREEADKIIDRMYSLENAKEMTTDSGAVIVAMGLLFAATRMRKIFP